MGRLIFGALATMLLLCAPLGASAQEVSSAEMEEEARARFQLGRVHLEQGRFEDAGREFEEAYRLSGRPELLFNIFVAYRDAGRNEEAANALREYLEQTPPDLEGRAQLEARLAVLDRQIAEAREADAAPPPAPPPPREASPAPWILVGTGAAIVVASVITGVIAIDMHSTLEAECSGGICDSSREDDLDTGRALALTTDVLWPIGAAVIAAGVIWAIVDASSSGSSDQTRAALLCTPDGCAASVVGRF